MRQLTNVLATLQAFLRRQFSMKLPGLHRVWHGSCFYHGLHVHGRVLIGFVPHRRAAACNEGGEDDPVEDALAIVSGNGWK